MRALALAAAGAAPAVCDLPVPEPGEGEVRVRVRAASLNGFDLAVTAGHLIGTMEHRYPVVLGKDFAGTVDAVGPGVTGWVEGDRVFGVVTKAFLGDGSFGDFVTVPIAVGLARLPEVVSFIDGAALGLAGTAAALAVEGAQLSAGRSVLVVGATGGVGTQVVQLAARAGARVVATARTREEEALVTGLGAAEVVDPTGDVAAQVRALHPDGLDAVVHLAGDAAAALPVVRRGGVLVSTLISSRRQLDAPGVEVVPVYAEATSDMLDQIAADAAQGRARVAVHQVYPLDQATDALAQLAAGARGKLVLSLG